MTTKCEFCSEEIEPYEYQPGRYIGSIGKDIQCSGYGGRGSIYERYHRPSTEGTQAAQPCPDCDAAKRHAYSDATTPGFFHPYCPKHVPAPVAQVDAPMKHYITKPQSEVIKEMVPVWEKAFTEACEALAKCGAEFCKHARREHKDSCGCLHPGCECDTFIPEPAVAQVDAGHDCKGSECCTDVFEHSEEWLMKSVVQTELPPLKARCAGDYHWENRVYLASQVDPYIASLTQRLQEQEAEIAKLQMGNVIDYKAACEQHAANFTAIQVSHDALLDAAKEIRLRDRPMKMVNSPKIAARWNALDEVIANAEKLRGK